MGFSKELIILSIYFSLISFILSGTSTITEIHIDVKDNTFVLNSKDEGSFAMKDLLEMVKELDLKAKTTEVKEIKPNKKQNLKHSTTQLVVPAEIVDYENEKAQYDREPPENRKKLDEKKNYVKPMTEYLIQTSVENSVNNIPEKNKLTSAYWLIGIMVIVFFICLVSKLVYGTKGKFNGLLEACIQERLI